MVSALKWAAYAWLGAVTTACYAVFIYKICEPLALILLCALIPVLLPPALLVLAILPGNVPAELFVASAAITLYLWLLGLLCFFMFGVYQRPRLPRAALY